MLTEFLTSHQRWHILRKGKFKWLLRKCTAFFMFGGCGVVFRCTNMSLLSIIHTVPVAACVYIWYHWSIVHFYQRCTDHFLFVYASLKREEALVHVPLGGTVGIPPSAHLSPHRCWWRKLNERRLLKTAFSGVPCLRRSLHCLMPSGRKSFIVPASSYRVHYQTCSLR